MKNIQGFDQLVDHTEHLQGVLQALDFAMTNGTPEEVKNALDLLECSEECFWFMHPDVAKEIKDSISTWCNDNGYTVTL
ncbi:hypothetical protein [Vibrio owensii]|uniref:hypothetical protein n=1 Tax=Vibrio owensii TaxID=696485 RepID=UPI0040680343